MAIFAMEGCLLYSEIVKQSCKQREDVQWVGLYLDRPYSWCCVIVDFQFQGAAILFSVRIDW